MNDHVLGTDNIEIEKYLNPAFSRYNRNKLCEMITETVRILVSYYHAQNAMSAFKQEAAQTYGDHVNEIGCPFSDAYCSTRDAFLDSIKRNFGAMDKSIAVNELRNILALNETKKDSIAAKIIEEILQELQ